MEKILTISIAAYQVESYLRQTLDSLMDESIIEDLEIFVVDDGGTDASLRIAQEYANRHPRSIFPVHKENGGYGSTISYSIEHATGKYFKLLDGDDWYEPEGLRQLVDLLKQIETDVVITPYFACIEGGEKKEFATLDGYVQNKDLLISELKGNVWFGMWSIAYRTEVIRTSKAVFPQHCFYTDQIYSTVPFGTAKTIRFFNCPVYCYRIGRDGQTTTKEARKNHIGDNQKVCEILYRFYEEEKERKNSNFPYLRSRITAYALLVIKTYMLGPVNEKMLSDIAAYDRHIKEISLDIYRMAGKVSCYKRSALIIRGMRVLRYGKLAEMFLKRILPPDGLANWI